MGRPAATDPWRALIEAGREDERLVRQAFEGERPARTLPIPPDLHPELVAALRGRGIDRLYAHQAEATALPADRPFVVTTGTASGKSLCFQLPAIRALLEDPRARALFVYPTKALAQDQARSLQAFGLHGRIRPAIYDGDTPRAVRRDVRTRANVILTNPDMLHVGILPRPDLWADLLSHLRVVVIDEAHVYRGVFGSHVANVLRRLRRLAQRYQAPSSASARAPIGSAGRGPDRARSAGDVRPPTTGPVAGRGPAPASGPRFLLATATIANAAEHAEALTGLEDIALIDEDGAPAARREILMWNPPLLDDAGPWSTGTARNPIATDEAALVDAADLVAGRTRRSALGEAGEMVAELVEAGARTICFVRSRKGVEVAARAAADELEERGRPELARRVVAYRAGYTTGQRHELEQRLVAGEIACVVTTTALELGIDIGELDAAVVVTFPGTVASLRQMWGRAGRRGRGLAVYVAGEDALDQYFCRHPEQFLDRPVEAAILQHETDPIHLGHLLCAAHEAPLDERDAPALGPRWRGHAEELARRGVLRERAGAFRPVDARRFPAGELSLRSASTRRVMIVDGSTGEELGHVEEDKAPATVHPGAVYLHRGERYEVADLDLESGYAVVAPFTGAWWTEPKREIEVAFERILDHREVGPDGAVPLTLGRVTVTDTVLAYQRRRAGSGAVIDLRTVDLPAVSFETEAIWFEPGALIHGAAEGRGRTPGRSRQAGGPAPAGEPSAPIRPAVPGGAEAFPTEVVLGALHATEHAQIAVLPLLAMCDRWDVGGLSTNLHPQTSGPAIVIYEGHVGGVGIARQAFRRFEELTDDAGRLVAECPCESGCPSCVQSPKCGNLNEPLHKAGALELLGRLLAPGR